MKRKWKNTPARRASARRNIRKAQAARLARLGLGKSPRSDHMRNLENQHIDPLRKDVPFTDADVEQAARWSARPEDAIAWERRYHETAQANMSLTQELQHLRRLARLVDFMTAKANF